MTLFELIRAFFHRADGSGNSRDAAENTRSIDEENGADELSDDPDRTAGNRRPAHYIPFYR